MQKIILNDVLEMAAKADDWKKIDHEIKMEVSLVLKKKYSSYSSVTSYHTTALDKYVGNSDDFGIEVVHNNWKTFYSDGLHTQTIEEHDYYYACLSKDNSQIFKSADDKVKELYENIDLKYKKK